MDQAKIESHIENQDMADLIQKVKAHGEITAQLVNAISKKIAGQYTQARCDEDKQKVAVTAMGWEEEGTRHLQMGFMFLLRALEQPATFA